MCGTDTALDNEAISPWRRQEHVCLWLNWTKHKTSNLLQKWRGKDRNQINIWAVMIESFKKKIRPEYCNTIRASLAPCTLQFLGTFSGRPEGPLWTSQGFVETQCITIVRSVNEIQRVCGSQPEIYCVTQWIGKKLYCWVISTGHFVNSFASAFWIFLF